MLGRQYLKRRYRYKYFQGGAWANRKDRQSPVNGWFALFDLRRRAGMVATEPPLGAGL